MAASDPSARRRIPVKLVDVPVELRLKAARELCRSAKTERERDELIGAALAPSGQVFYIADDDRAAA
jgi:hypothetical protein